MSDKRPIIGISMGDPAGCGPEITIKALCQKDLYERCRPLVVGDANVLDDNIRILTETGFIKENEIHTRRISSVSEAEFSFGSIDVLHMDLVDMQKLQYGVLSPMCGKAAYLCVDKVIDLAMNHEVDATVTNALNKEAMNLAGYHYSGHTEIYADHTGTRSYAMMLVHENLRVVHVSTHVALREACDRVKKDRVLECIRLAYQECQKIGIKEPKVAVAGLNPHAGEGGLFGREEIEEIIPAIEAAREEGYPAEGPLPADSVFSKALGGWYDIVVVMYHDQGHIPLKTVGFVYDREAGNWKAVKGVNVTLGLPIIRTSVDHGTAFDRAGRGIQNEDSLINAIDYAIQSANTR